MLGKASQNNFRPDKQKALVRIIRTEKKGICQYPVYDNGKLIGELYPQAQIEYLVEPGKHLFLFV